MGVEDINYEVTGDGDAIVLLHSFLCSKEMWRPQINFLSQRYKVVAIDFRGHGASPHISRKFDLQDLVEDVLTVLDNEGIATAAWAGLSVGGMVSLRAAIKFPHRVSKLIILDSTASVERTANKIQTWIGFLGQAVLGQEWALDRIIPMFFSKRTIQERPHLVSEWRGRFASTDMTSMKQMSNAFKQRKNITSLLNSIKIPTLVIVGAEDVLLPIAESELIAKNISGAALKVIPNCGHLTTLEQPEIVNKAIAEFLADLSYCRR